MFNQITNFTVAIADFHRTQHNAGIERVDDGKSTQIQSSVFDTFDVYAICHPDLFRCHPMLMIARDKLIIIGSKISLRCAFDCNLFISILRLWKWHLIVSLLITFEMG